MLRLTTLCLFLSLLGTSCANYIPQGYLKQTSVDKKYTIPYFNDAEVDYVYKSSIVAFGKDLGGILIIKKVSPLDYRVVMTTEFGNKLFDFQLSDTKFKVNFIIEPLDKNIIINTLRKDFQLLLKRDYQLTEKYTMGVETLFNSKEGNKKYQMLFKDDALSTVVRMKRNSPRVKVHYIETRGEKVDSLAIVHSNGRLSIGLKAISL